MCYNVPMRQRFRIRRIAKWTGLVLCVAILLAWGASGQWAVFWVWSDGVNTRTWAIFRGRIVIQYPAAPIGDPPGWHVERLVYESLVDRLRPGPPGPHILHWNIPPVTFLHIPLWIPLVLLGVSTALLWWRDRRPPRGHCRTCGYNLTGNTSGVCPECGEAT